MVSLDAVESICLSANTQIKEERPDRRTQQVLSRDQLVNSVCPQHA